MREMMIPSMSLFVATRPLVLCLWLDEDFEYTTLVTNIIRHRSHHRGACPSDREDVRGV